MSDSLWHRGLQHARLPCPSPTPKACSNSCPSSQWCHPTILSSVVPFSSCLQSFPASRVFSSESALRIRLPKYWVSASASVLPMNIQSWFPLGLTGLISLLSKGLSRVLSNTTVQKCQFFGAQLPLLSNSHTHTLQSMGLLRVGHDWATSFTFHFQSLEKEMATHSSVLAWRIPGTGEPGGLPSMGSHRVGHDWSNLAAAAAAHPYMTTGKIIALTRQPSVCKVMSLLLICCLGWS